MCSKKSKRIEFGQQKMCFAMTLLIVILCYSCGNVAYAAEEGNSYDSLAYQQEERICSHGRLVYQEEGMAEALVYDGTDIWEIKRHLDYKKTEMLQKLLQLGTSFVQTDAGWQYSRNPENRSGNIPGGEQIEWDILLNAVRNSQSVPEEIAVREPKFPLQIEGVAEHMDFYQAATADNLSKGKAAWLDGMLLLGTGADNDKAYAKGKEDGAGGVFRPDMCPIYATGEQEVTIQHKHIGNSVEIEGISGCYHNYTTKEVSQSVCGGTLQQTESTWYPNESEEGGGSWHGGYYTCPWHGGIYQSAGTCDSVSSQEKTIWHHDIVCGKTDLVYATLKITGADEDYLDGKMKVQAEILSQDGFSNLLLPETEQEHLIWSNEQGEIIGKGAFVEIAKAGIYSCKLAALNQDVTCLDANVPVVIKGFTYTK
ncbi:MAG: hypothetical protein IJO97_02115 [Lachnospiraceae bacterium]|nr:hypothetical protein [Lachnospiraceae bacterium]